MKPITLHPVSVLVGLLLAGLMVLASGAAQSPGVVHHPRTEVVGQVPAEWWTYVELSPTQSFTVPADRYFVVTGTGDPYSSNPNLLEDGQATGRVSILVSWRELVWGGNGGVGEAIDMNGTRVVFAPGTSLTQPSLGSITRLWGYLEPTR